MIEQTQTKPSSLVKADVLVRTPIEQFKLPTWGVIVTLIIALVVIKSFIYIKDPKRDGK